jgi:aspartate/methionine/tyrosine aminotransferase
MPNSSTIIQPMALKMALRNGQIAPFHVMEIVKAAAALSARGEDVIHMSIGEPDFTAPAPVQAELALAVAQGRGAYTSAMGLIELRLAIAGFYRDRFAVEVDPARILITAGASGAMLLALAALVEGGDEVLLPDPSYPCNRHFVASVGASARLIACGPEQRFQLTAADVVAHWNSQTRGVLAASPSNPTGTSIAWPELVAIQQAVLERAGFLMVDEIYQSLSYDLAPGQPQKSALSLPQAEQNVIVLNSFSKYFNMTGWRLGWMVVPPAMVANVEKLAQNLFICPSALAQYAALACFSSETLQIYESRRAQFEQRRNYLVPALRKLGFIVPVQPDGAFYVYADASAHDASSDRLAYRLLQEAKVCIVPGKDFGFAAPERYVRLSYATALPRLQEAVERIGRALG